jgi:hypothetical protein
LVSRAAVMDHESYSNGNESHYNEPIEAKPLHWNYYQVAFFWNSTRLEYELNMPLWYLISHLVISAIIGALIIFIYLFSLFCLKDYLAN